MLKNPQQDVPDAKYQLHSLPEECKPLTYWFLPAVYANESV